MTPLRAEQPLSVMISSQSCKVCCRIKRTAAPSTCCCAST
jgi:hypothetical protein